MRRCRSPRRRPSSARRAAPQPPRPPVPTRTHPGHAQHPAREPRAPRTADDCDRAPGLARLLDRSTHRGSPGFDVRTRLHAAHRTARGRRLDGPWKNPSRRVNPRRPAEDFTEPPARARDQQPAAGMDPALQPERLPCFRRRGTTNFTPSLPGPKGQDGASRNRSTWLVRCERVAPVRTWFWWGPGRSPNSLENGRTEPSGGVLSQLRSGYSARSESACQVTKKPR